jgi:N-acetyl-gamma-glutamylphosphate reductase
LIKGGAGQAIQNMNLRFNFPEAKGLKWKRYYYFFY